MGQLASRRRLLQNCFCQNVLIKGSKVMEISGPPTANCKTKSANIAKKAIFFWGMPEFVSRFVRYTV
jgi:hypothetical protein